jgi:hypothetical protein
MKNTPRIEKRTPLKAESVNRQKTRLDVVASLVGQKTSSDQQPECGVGEQVQITGVWEAAKMIIRFAEIWSARRSKRSASSKPQKQQSLHQPSS